MTATPPEYTAPISAGQERLNRRAPAGGASASTATDAGVLGLATDSCSRSMTGPASAAWRGANREGPARQGDRCHREQQRAHEGETPDQMARGRRRAPAQERGHTAGGAQQQRNLDHQQRRRGHGGIEKGRAHRSSPCSRTRFSRLLKRRYSASDSGVDVMSSSAAIADPVELSKKVRTSCRSADRLASSGFTAGK